MKLKDRITVILSGGDKPLSFDKIYAKLEADEHPMPERKPKLKVRQVLYNKEHFDVLKGGLFGLKGEGSAEGAPAAKPVSKPTPKQAKPEPDKLAETIEEIIPNVAKKSGGLPPKPEKKDKPPEKPKAEEKSKEPVKPPAGDAPKLKDRIITVLKQADKPMSFEKIYAGLEKDGYPLPKKKPKLKARQTLYKTEFFGVEKGGLYTVKEGIDAAPFKKPEPAKSEEPKAKEAKPEELKLAPVPTISSANEDFIAKAREEARAEARKIALEAAAEVREQAIKEAKEAAVIAAKEAAIAAREAAAEVAREAAIDQAKLVAEHEAAKQVAIAAAREMAREAATEAAAAARAEAQKVAQEAAVEVAEAAATARAETQASQAAEVAKKAETDSSDAEMLAAARAAREVAAQAVAAVDSIGKDIVVSAPPSTQQTSVSAPEQDLSSKRSGSQSIRERASKAISKAGKPLTFDEVFKELGQDGYPLPPKNTEQVVQRVLENKLIFQEVAPGLFMPNND